MERFNRTILASLRHYVAEHPKDWDLFSDALTYAYNTQAHESTSVAPFELVLSRPPAPLAFEATPSMDAVSDEAQYHKKWTTYAKALTSTARREMEKRQLRYKRGFDDRVMPYKEDVTVGTYVFLRKDHTNPRRESNKLAPIATGPYKVTAREANTVTIERENLEREKVSRDRVVRAPTPMGIVIAYSVPPVSGTPLTEVDVEATPDSISVNPSVGLADIPPSLTEGESHLKGVHTRFIKYLRPARTTQSWTNSFEAEADSEPAPSQEATPPSRGNPRVNDLTPGGPPPPEEAANVTHPPWEVTQGEPSANEREQDLKKVTSHSAFDDESAENSETQKDEVSQFLSSRSEESSIAKNTSSQVDQALKKVTSSHSFPSYDPVKGNAQKDEHPQFLRNALNESTIAKGSSSDEDQALKKVPSSDTVLRPSENENPLRGLISAIRSTSTRMTGLFSTKSPGVPRMNKLFKRIHVLTLLATSAKMSSNQ